MSLASSVSFVQPPKTAKERMQSVSINGWHDHDNAVSDLSVMLLFMILLVFVETPSPFAMMMSHGLHDSHCCVSPMGFGGLVLNSANA